MRIALFLRTAFVLALAWPVSAGLAAPADASRPATLTVVGGTGGGRYAPGTTVTIAAEDLALAAFFCLACGAEKAAEPFLRRLPGPEAEGVRSAFR